MSTYRKIHGRSIQAVTTDPSESVAEGQVWYNTTTDTFKTVLVSEAWSSASALNTAVYDNAGAGTQTAALNVGGTESPSVARSDNTEEYNGSGWSNSGNLNTARFGLGGFGTQTAAYVAGGNVSPGGGTTAATESYNGTSWTSLSSPANLASPRQNMPASTMGPGSAGFMVGGASGGPYVGNVEEWDGSAWSEVADLSTARGSSVGAGTQSAATIAGGYNPGTDSALVEEWNGSSWTAGTALPVATNGGYRVGNLADDFYFAGGQAPSPVSTTRRYDGTTWTTSASMGSISAGSGGSPGSSTPSAGIAFGGNNPPPSISTTEEFNRSANVITAAAWASATAMNTGRGRFGASGGKDSALAAGGYTVPSNTSNTEKYDGTSWTESGNLPVAKNSFPLIGSQTASIACGGYTPPTYTTASDTFDGSSWTSAPTMSTGRESAAGSTASPYNAVVVYGGYEGSSPHFQGHTEEFDGSSWSEQNNMPTALSKMGGGGTQTAAISSGGDPPVSNLTQFYDGTNWTTGPATLLNAQQWHGYAGTQTANFIFGGSTSPDSNSSGVSQAYDGSSWATAPNLGTPRYAVGGSGQGTPTSASAFGGLISPIGPGAKNFTEEFTGETSAVNVKTLTQS